jgi:pimeloyl-ACP methyl ester carboxylesterase
MLHFEQRGEGPVWVFLHGFLESSTMWDYLPLDALPIQQIRIDLSGHGHSSAILNTPSIQEIATEVQQVLAHLSISSFSVIGHSMGGYVGLELSQLEGFKHLILLNSNCWSDSDQKKHDRLRVAQIVQNAKDIFIREAIPHLFRDASANNAAISKLIDEAKHLSANAIAQSTLAMRERTDFTEFVNAHPEKFTFIHGIHDRLVSVDELQQKVPNGKIHFLDCGHMAHIEAGEELLGILIHLMKND